MCGNIFMHFRIIMVPVFYGHSGSIIDWIVLLFSVLLRPSAPFLDGPWIIHILPMSLCFIVAVFMFHEHNSSF